MNQELTDAWKRAPRQRKIRPGRMLFFVHASKGTWRVPLRQGKTVEEAFGELFDKLHAASADGQTRLADETPLRGPYFKVRRIAPLVMEVDFISPIIKYLDVGTLTCEKEPHDGALTIRWYNESSGYFPVRNRWCVTLGLLFFWFPFGDRGWYTTFAMRQLKTLAQELLAGGDIGFTFQRYIPLRY